jgi:drug/metabolite transporter (DMT)-like permease
MFHKMTPKQAMLGGALTALIMGGFIVLSRFGVREIFNAADLTIFRYLSGLLLLPIFLRLDLKTLGGIGWIRAILLTIGAGWPFNMLLMSGFNYAPAAHGAVFGPGTMPMFTAILSWIILGIRPSTYQLSGLIALFVGLVMLGWGGFLESSPGAWRGDLFFLSGAFCWACFTVAVRHWNIDPVQAIAVVGVLSLVTFLPIYSLFFNNVFLTASIADLSLQIFYQGFLVGIVAVLFFASGIQILGPTRITLFIALVPVIGVLLGIPILNELPGKFETFGIVVVVLGVLAAMGVRPKMISLRANG